MTDLRRTGIDARRAAASARLRRAKRAVAAGSAVLSLALWSLVASSASARSNPAVSPSPSSITVPPSSPFDQVSPDLGGGSPAIKEGGGLTPVMRSGGS